jgi:predicted AAA+ superfamily ATPase
MNARTVESYLEILKLTYVCYPVHSFSRNYANELKKSRKYYLYDLGIRNTLLKNFAPLSGRSDSGAIIESFVFLELCRQIGPENEIRFWRLKDGSEVDFIWVKNQKYFPIEVKATIKKDEIPPGLRAFISKYPDTKTAYIVSQNFTGQTQYRDTKINYIKLGKVALIPQQC